MMLKKSIPKIAGVMNVFTTIKMGNSVVLDLYTGLNVVYHRPQPIMMLKFLLMMLLIIAQKFTHYAQ